MLIVSEKNCTNQSKISTGCKIVLKDTATPTDTLLLTRGQIRKIEKVRDIGKRCYKTIRMSKNQIEKNGKYQGGYLQHLNDTSINDLTNSMDKLY